MRGEFGTVPRILRIRGLSLNSRYNEDVAACDAGSIVTTKTVDECQSWEEVLDLIRMSEQEIRLGGGETAVERQHEKGRLTARERIERLIDPGSTFFELGLFAAFEMYQEWGGAAAAGVITGIGQVQKRHFMIIANDATVKAGAFFPTTVKKVLRAQHISLENHLPLIYLVDSAGVFLPLQDEVFPDENDFGRIFRYNARISAQGIPQIAAIMGSCVAGGAYLPVMCDKILMTEGSGLYIAGPSLVKAAIGQDLDSEDLGGAQLHSTLSGTIDFREKTDKSCLDRVGRLVGTLAKPSQAPFQRVEAQPPDHSPEEIYDLMPLDPSQEYDVLKIFQCIFDNSEFMEYKAEYGKTLICGYARLAGWSVGVVANRKQHIKTPDGPFEVGGVIYRESADKAARFVMDCNQSRIPLLFFQDVSGFMVGREAEISGIIKSGAKLVNVVANSVVPKITVIMGGSYGAGNYALCGKAYDPRFIFAWPTCRYAVMGGKQAAKTLLALKVRQLEKKDQKITEEARQQMLESIQATYDHQLDPRYGAARLWVDRIIQPHQTREALQLSLEVAALNPQVPEFKTGVLQV
ncbi:MAG: acyl-CoA carboxylase subunit beta [Acidobacteria bacterium]|nr:MAG: acyl-CoA carboxylase subunit beta [Acidobacteriota bacterium]